MKKEKICGIYKIISPSGKIYIGQSKDINHRFDCYRGLHCKKQTLLYRSLVKHGVNNHKFEVVIECSIDRLDKFEIGYIRIFDTFNTKHGLNLQNGGNVRKASDETKKRMSIGCMGNKNGVGSKGNLGKKASEESKRKRSESMKGHASWSKGRHQSEEAKQKIREYQLGRKKDPESIEKTRQANIGRKASAETRKNMSIAQRNKPPVSEETRRKLSEGLVLRHRKNKELKNKMRNEIT